MEKKKHNVVPIYKEYYADTLTPVQALRILKERYDNLFLLESADHSGIRGRYSFLGFNPVEEYTVSDGCLYRIKDGEKTLISKENPTEHFKEILESYNSPVIEDLPNFTGGFVGYFSYDYYKYKEPTLKFENSDNYFFPDMHLALFTDLIVFDHFRDKVLLITNLFEGEPESEGKERIKSIRKILNTSPKTVFTGSIVEEFKPNFSKEDYKDLVEKARSYIIEGDIFQVVVRL